MMAKKLKIIFVLGFLLILLSSLSQAQELNLEIVLESNGDAIVFGNSEIDPFIKGIDFENNSISGISSELTSKKGEIWTFALSSNQSYGDYYARIRLPQGAKLLSYSNNPLVSSEQSSLVLEFSDNQSLNLQVTYTLEKISREINWTNIIFFFILVLVIIAVIVLFFINQRRHKEIKKMKKIVKKKTSKLQDMRKILNERENLIINTLVKQGRKSTHGRLQKLSGIPKASFSRHLNNLAKKGIVFKEGTGKLNIVRLRIR